LYNMISYLYSSLVFNSQPLDISFAPQVYVVCKTSLTSVTVTYTNFLQCGQ